MPEIRMLAEELAQKMDMELLLPEMAAQEIQISGCYIGDLLSNVMGNALSGQLWLTIMNNVNVVAVAQLIELSGIVLLEGASPVEGFLERAAQENIPVYLTKEPAFAMAVKLYEAGIAGV